MANERLEDARAISGRWLEELDMGALVRARVAEAGLHHASVDVVAVGKASREMVRALESAPDVTIRRRLIIADTSLGDEGPDVVIGEHPLPAAGSLEAGRRMLEFLDAGSGADATLFLVSGGASSLCVAPVAPISLDDLRGLWDAVVATGADITTLNQLRAATSWVSGGAVLGHRVSPRSLSLVLVDNVVSGVQWVASGLTFPYDPSPVEVTALLEGVGLADTPLGDRWLTAAARRRDGVSLAATGHENRVLGEPAAMLRATVVEARRRGYDVLDLGAALHGDVAEVAAAFASALEHHPDRLTCVVGVGEVTVQVAGGGVGGRCQEFVWRLAESLARLGRGAVALARASDGRDFVDGVGGAWSDETTVERAGDLGLDWGDVARRHDTYPALSSLGQLLEGGRTGWNLCDLYLVLGDAT